jgi:hypothetical protein
MHGREHKRPIQEQGDQCQAGDRHVDGKNKAFSKIRRPARMASTMVEKLSPRITNDAASRATSNILHWSDPGLVTSCRHSFLQPS